jgi:hypothetical protein
MLDGGLEPVIRDLSDNTPHVECLYAFLAGIRRGLKPATGYDE